jgi:hypothetical protein
VFPTRVTSSTSEILSADHRYVLVRRRIAVVLAQAEVDDVQDIRLLADAHEKIIGFQLETHGGEAREVSLPFGTNVSMDERSIVHALNASNSLIDQHEYRLRAELTLTKVEQVLQGRAE